MDKNGNHFNSPEGVSLKEYVNDKLDNLEKSIDARFDGVTLTTNAALASADKATLKAESATEKRFEGVNEFRNTLSDQQRTFMPRSEVEIMIKAINGKIDSLNLTTISRQSADTGRKEGMGTVALIAGVISTVIAIIFRFIN